MQLSKKISSSVFHKLLSTHICDGADEIESNCLRSTISNWRLITEITEHDDHYSDYLNPSQIDELLQRSTGCETFFLSRMYVYALLGIVAQNLTVDDDDELDHVCKFILVYRGKRLQWNN